MIPIIKHVKIEGPGLITRFFERTRYQTKIIELEKKDPLPESFDDMEAIIVLGGPMNVYEEKKYVFLRDEDIFLKKAKAPPSLLKRMRMRP